MALCSPLRCLLTRSGCVQGVAGALLNPGPPWRLALALGRDPNCLSQSFELGFLLQPDVSLLCWGETRPPQGQVFTGGAAP